MANFTSPFGARVFAQAQPNLLTVQNSGGSWTSSGAQYIRVMDDSLHLTPEEPKVPANFLHGTASPLARMMARKSGQWSLNVPIVPSGTQGVPPDIDVILRSIFGGAGALVTGTIFGNAWEYNIVDRTAVPLTLFEFQHGVSATGNLFALGAVPQRATIEFNGNILGASLNGVSVAVVENETFSVLDSVAQGGLAAFPSEPGSISYNGSLINAFGGPLYVNGQQFSDMCDAFTLEVQTGQELKGDFVDSARPLAVIFGRRNVMVTMGFVNNDSSVLASLKAWARQNTPVEVDFYLGTVAGQRLYVKVRGVQFVPASLTETSNSYLSCSFGQSAASVTPGNANDVSIGFA